MSLAGCIGLAAHDLGFAETGESLRRQALRANSEASVLRHALGALGTVDGSSSWVSSDPAQPVIAVFDGRLYERDVMCRLLEVSAICADAEIAGRAFLKWGDTFADHLDGEYAFAVWDPGGRRLLIGVDAMSRGAMHYSRVGDGFAFASEMSGLSGWHGVDDRIAPEMIARTLSVDPLPGRTIYRGIDMARGGHVTVLSPAAPVHALRYWHPLRRPQMLRKDSREYAEALHAAMERAVGVRLPAEGLVASHLSSGFDSSSVTALVAQALAKQNRPLLAYTSVPTRRTDARAISLNRFDDEWPLAAKVAAMYPNIEHVPIRTDGADWWESLDLPSDLAGGPTGFIRNSRWYVGILKDAASRGAVSMFEGQAGNMTGSYNGAFGLYDLRRRGQWSALVRAIRDRRRHGQPWKSLIGDTWMPSAEAKARIQRLRGKPVRKFNQLSLMREDFYRSTGLTVRTLSPMGAAIEGDRSNGSAWRFSILSFGNFGMMGAMHRRGFGIEREDPTADRRLVELCLSMPDEAFSPRGVPRQLYRDAFQQDLPSELLNERLRGLQSSDFLEMFAEWMPEWYAETDRLEQTPAVTEILDLRRLRALLDAYPEMIKGSREAADLTYNYTVGGALALGRFLRRYEERKNSLSAALT